MVGPVDRTEQTQSAKQPKEISKSLAETKASVSELITQQGEKLLRPRHTISKNMTQDANKIVSIVEHSNFSTAGSPLKLKTSLKTPKGTDKVELLAKKTKAS